MLKILCGIPIQSLLLLVRRFLLQEHSRASLQILQKATADKCRFRSLVQNMRHRPR